MTNLDSTWDETLRGPRMSQDSGRIIFKYQMPVLEQFTMKLPAGAEIIRMTDQDGMFWLWAVVNTNAPMETRHFRAFKTGARMPDNVNLKYIGFCAVMVQMELGLYIFEEFKSSPKWRLVKETHNQKSIDRIEASGGFDDEDMEENYD